MRILLDTNVVLDLVLRRAPWVIEAEQIWDAHRLRTIEACVSASALTDIFYITKRLTDQDKARQTVREILTVLTILTVDRDCLIRADQSDTEDFEDALQIEVAQTFRCGAIVTRDAKDFRRSHLKIFSPTDLLKIISPTPESTADEEIPDEPSA